MRFKQYIFNEQADDDNLFKLCKDYPSKIATITQPISYKTSKKIIKYITNCLFVDTNYVLNEKAVKEFLITDFSSNKIRYLFIEIDDEDVFNPRLKKYEYVVAKNINQMSSGQFSDMAINNIVDLDMLIYIVEHWWKKVVPREVQRDILDQYRISDNIIKIRSWFNKDILLEFYYEWIKDINIYGTSILELEHENLLGSYLYDAQKYVLEKDPTLINKIPDLDPRLKEIYKNTGKGSETGFF